MNPSPISDAQQWASTLMQSRRTVLPRRLEGPGPDALQKRAIVEAAASAPDHDQLLPWRFIEVPLHRRPDLGQAFAQALLERDPLASAQEQQQAHDKALRAPWLLLAVVRTQGDPVTIGAEERLASAGAAIQNMLLMATAMGLGSSLTSGKAMASSALRRLFGLPALEQALCFINFGHIRDTPKVRSRPAAERYFSILE